MPSPFDTMTTPPASQLLGWELIREDPEKGEIEIAFHPNASMTNPHGSIQGGFVAAMLDDAMGPALLVGSQYRFMASTIDMNVSYLKPVRPGRVICVGRVLRLGRAIAFLEAELSDQDGNLLARATSSAIPVPVQGQ